MKAFETLSKKTTRRILARMKPSSPGLVTGYLFESETINLLAVYSTLMNNSFYY